MNKKKSIKLGVCSLLVGLLALTACSKKKTTLKPTTKDPTTKTTTEKSSSKPTTKKPTTQKTTTEDLSTLVRLDVYIGDKKISDEYNVVDVVYGEDYDLESLVFVRGVKDNNTEVVLTDFDVETELTPTSNVGTYDVTISYGALTPVVFSVKVNQKEIDASALEFDYTEAYTYDKESHSVALKNVPTGLVVSYETNEEAGNSKTNAGNYETIAILSVENDNYKIINYEGPINVLWKINKATIDMSDVHWNYAGPMEYTGEERTIGVIGLPEGVTASYSGDASAINAGTYNVSVSFNYDSDNYNLENGTIASSFEWKISKATYDFTGAHWDYTKAFTYDGHEKSVEIAFLPLGINASYTNNKATNAGTYTATVVLELENDNYEIINADDLDYSISWTINKAEFDLSETVWDFDYENPFIYDKEEHEIRLVNLPEGVNVTYSGIKKATNAGDYTVYVEIDTKNPNYTISNYDHIDKTFVWEIAKAKIDMSNVRWDYDEFVPFVYNGETYTVKLINVPDEITSIDYYDNYGVYADYYSAEAWLDYDYDNYELINGPVDCYEIGWEIEKAKIDMSNVEWDYDSNPFTYDGEEHHIRLINIPDDIIDVEYYDCDGTDADTYDGYADIDYDDENYELVFGSDSYSCLWEIEKAEIDLQNVCWDYDPDSPFDYDGETHSVKLLNVPDEVEVSYDCAEATDADTYYAVAYLEYNEINYSLVNAPDYELYEIEWVINKAIAKVNTFEVESKTYDGEAISANVDVETDGDITVLYKGLYDDDDAYTEEAPKDAGSYIAKLVVENNYNYTDIEEEYTVEFYILKKAAKKVVANNNTFVTLKTGAEQTLEIPGYDPNIHYLMRGTSVEESIKATDVGSYTFGLYLKDPKNYYWEGYNQNTTSYFQFTWIITDNFFTEIKINGKEKTYDELVNYIFAKNETVKLTVAEGYTAIIKKNGNSVASGQSIEYSVLYSDNILDFYVQQGSTNVWYQRYNIGNGFIKKLEVNGNVYNTGVNNAYIELNANDTELNIELLDYDDNYDYSIYYEDGTAQKRAEFVNGKLIEQIIITGSKKIYINARSKETQSNYAGILILYVKEFNPIETLSVSSYNLYNGTLYDHDVAQSEYSNEYYIYPEMYAGSQQMGNSIVTGINLAFKEGYEDCTFEIVDADTLEEHDFTKIKQDIDVYIHIYRDGTIIYKTDAIIYNKVAYLIDSDSYYNLGREIAFYHTYKGDELEFDFKLEDSKYIYGDYKVLLNGIESMYKTYDNEGVYTEKITLLFDVYGVTYTQEVDCDVICSEDLYDFGNFRIYSRYEGYSSENEIYAENNIFETEFDIYSYTHLKEDWFNYEIDDELEFINKEFYFINVDDSENRRLILKITLSYEGTNYSIYTICTLNENFMSSTDIADEKIWRTNVYNPNDGYNGYKIEDNIITVTDATKGDYVELDFFGFVNALVYKDNEIIAGRSEKYVDWIRFRLEEAGEYKLVINDLFGNERIVTINVSGNFNNVIEATIGNSTLFFNELDSDNIKKRVGAEGAVISVGYFGSSAASYIDEGKVEVTLSGVALGYIYKDDNLEELITTSPTTFNVLYDNDNKPYISIFIGNDYTQKELILYLTDKPTNVVTIDFGNNQEYHFFGDEYGFDGDFTESGDGINYILEVDSIGESFTLTTDQVYSDYSYAVIMAPINFLMIGLYEGDYSLEELEEMGYLYRVTDTTTKSITIPLISPTIYILNLGTYEFDWNMISHFSLTKCNIFSAKTEDKEFYAVLSQSADAMLYEDVNYKLETNADVTYESTSILGGASFAAYYEFCLGAEEKKNIITIGGEKYYKFKIHSGLGLTIYDDWYSTNELVPDEDGYIYLLVRGYGTGDYCEFYLDGYILNEKIGVCFDFLDRIPKPGTQIVGEAISKSNLVLSNKEYAINESDAVTINDWNPADNYTIEFKELVNVELYNDNDNTLVYESEDLTDKITVKFDKPGTYVLCITDIEYNEREVVITVSDSEGGVPILGVPTTNGINVFDDDSSTQYGFFKRDNGYVTYLGSDIAEYVSSENTLLMPIVGYGVDYLYTDLALEHKLELNDDYSVLVNVLTDDNDKLYILLYLDTINGALPIRIYLVDRTLSGTTVTIGDKTYNIGTSPDDLGDLIHYLDLNDFDCYSLTHRGRSATITFNYDTLYDDYSYAIICTDYQTSVYDLIYSGASFEDLENMGLLFTTKDKDQLSFTYTIKENIDYPIYFYVVPYGAKSIHDFNIYDDFCFEIQLDYTLFDITIGDKNYYATNYTDWTDEDRYSEFDSNADEAIYNDDYEYYEGLVYCIGEAEESNIVEGTYTFKMDSNLVDVFYLDKRLENSLAINDGYVTLTVKEKDGIKYVDFYYGITFTGTCNVTLMFIDELPE